MKAQYNYGNTIIRLQIRINMIKINYKKIISFRKLNPLEKYTKRFC